MTVVELVENICLGSEYLFPKKSWFWGMYPFGKDSSYKFLPEINWEITKDYQHNFVVHSGSKKNWNEGYHYLRHEDLWYTEGNGGFDGRWVQLFED